MAAETFTSKVERLKLQILQSTPTPQLLESIAEDVSRLPDITERLETSESAKLALSNDLATAARRTRSGPCKSCSNGRRTTA